MPDDEGVPIHMREQFARWEADFDLEKAQQMAAQVPAGLVAGQAFKVMTIEKFITKTPYAIFCKYDGTNVMALKGRDAYRASVQLADEQLAVGTVELPALWTSAFENLQERFPSIPRDRIAAILKVHDGRAGMASGALEVIVEDATPTATESQPKEQPILPAQTSPDESRVDNLHKRFPHLPRETIAAVLKREGGHAGRAAGKLKSGTTTGDYAKALITTEPAPKRSMEESLAGYRAQKEANKAPPPSEAETTTKVQNLQRRFPNVAESDIIAALEKHDGHGGEASTDLASRYTEVYDIRPHVESAEDAKL